MAHGAILKRGVLIKHDIVVNTDDSTMLCSWNVACTHIIERRKRRNLKPQTRNLTGRKRGVGWKPMHGATLIDGRGPIMS